jgi:hypothetical protein
VQTYQRKKTHISTAFEFKLMQQFSEALEQILGFINLNESCR